MKTKYRKIQGRDWHGWAFYDPGKDGVGMCHWAEPIKPKGQKPSNTGKWVRVKFVRVDR
jgi:hypothetical protein